MKRSTLWFSLAIAVLSVGCGKKAADDAAAADDAKPTVTVQVAPVSRRSMPETVDLQGAFVPSQGGFAKLAASGPGRIAKVLVREGQKVTKGELLAQLDTKVQSAQAQSAAAAAKAAQAGATQSGLAARAAAADQDAALRTAQLALQTAIAQRDADNSQAKLALQTAQSDLAKTLAGARPQEIAQAAEATRQARIAFQKASQEATRIHELAHEGYASKRQVEQADADRDTARSALAAAQQGEALVRAGARPEEKQAARLRVSAAKEAVNSAAKLGNQRVQQAQSALIQAQQDSILVEAKRQEAAAAQANAVQKSADLTAAAATAGLTEIRAPFDGVIAKRDLNPGDLADTTTPILEISGGGASDFVGTLPAADAGQLKPGMAALVTPSDKTKEKYQGRVTGVSPADPATGLCSIRIVCGAHELSGGYTTAEVTTAIHPNALAVPSDSVVNRDGKSVVYVVDGETAKQVEVETGGEADGLIEITKGLKGDETVVKIGQYELSDGAKIKQAEPDKGEADKGDKGAADDKKADDKKGE